MTAVAHDHDLADLDDLRFALGADSAAVARFDNAAATITAHLTQEQN